MQVQRTDAPMAATSATSPSPIPPAEDSVVAEEVSSHACITRPPFDMTAANDYPLQSLQAVRAYLTAPLTAAEQAQLSDLRSKCKRFKRGSDEW